MNWRKFGAATVATAALGTGGTIVADKQINPYTDAGAKLELSAESTVPEAGAVKTELAKDHPAVTLSKWDGEAAMTVSYDKVHAEGSRKFLTDTMEWKGGTEDVHAYPLEAKADMEDGGFEVEVVLNEKPDTNVFEFTIDGADDLDFFYQPALTEQEVARGNKRPENVIGSYAVYHKENANHREGEMNYATGKAYHIYRPKAVDADGNEEWAELHYVEGKLSVTVPQKFLENATYPVTVDPTFGFTGIGASGTSWLDYNIASKFTMNADGGTGTSMSSYIDTGGSGTLGMAVYADTASAPGSQITNGNIPRATATAGGWTTLNFASGPTLVASTAYWLGGSYHGTLSGNIRYDSGTGTYKYQFIGNVDEPNPYGSPLGSLGDKVSIYVTYTAAGGGTSVLPPDIIQSN